MTLYNISLGVLELLKPYVFRPEYLDALDSALKCYFDMVYSYFNRRDSIYGLIGEVCYTLSDLSPFYLNRIRRSKFLATTLHTGSSNVWSFLF